MTHPDAQLVLFTPDTKVVVLAVAHYKKLCKGTSLFMVSHSVDGEPLWRTLGREKVPVFYAFTSTDNIGNFSGIRNGFSST